MYNAMSYENSINIIKYVKINLKNMSKIFILKTKENC